MVSWGTQELARGGRTADPGHLAAELRRDACSAATSPAAPVVGLDDVRRAYPTWRCWPTVDGCVAQAALVPSLTVRAATAPGLLHEIEASIQRRREGGTR